ncbi:hypothetical protein BDP55DRAFT_759818 [Colletotrichum godetiae]|uniref:DUF6546 domain-containing protein n=1 Tax=Colletotrichum godetiae TaxID=1209918 RepID=A0AAJ0ASB6_9PEZI|nr:uncharacterized protein BDP55DRAFT_759818 [Colletotrichum godetiae]KAK1689475.1 hypothetical protein BDP55DRAFT_759818 [Colletotrichum godetiae]
MTNSLISDIDLITMLAIWSSPPEEAPLSKIHIFEHGDLYMLSNRRLSVSRALAGALFIRSLELEELVCCNIIDATLFFAACTRRRRIPISPLSWQRLRVLAMTSQNVSSREKPELINALIPSWQGREANAGTPCNGTIRSLARIRWNFPIPRHRQFCRDQLGEHVEVQAGRRTQADLAGRHAAQGGSAGTPFRTRKAPAYLSQPIPLCAPVVGDSVSGSSFLSIRSTWTPRPPGSSSSYSRTSRHLLNF